VVVVRLVAVIVIVVVVVVVGMVVVRLVAGFAWFLDIGLMAKEENVTASL